MSEIKFVKASSADADILMEIRLEMLREVNSLPESYVYDSVLTDESRRYFEDGDCTNVLAFDGDVLAGCASLSYIRVMPTFSHPSGKRAHLMNVYTRAAYRRRGISKRMIELLIAEAREKGVTEISLDATEAGRPLYEKMGFKASGSAMTMEL